MAKIKSFKKRGGIDKGGGGDNLKREGQIPFRTMCNDHVRQLPQS